MKVKKKLTTVILISLLLGTITGILFYYLLLSGYFREVILINGIFNIVGNDFICLMQMLIVSPVFCSLVCYSMTTRDMKTLVKVGVKTVSFTW